jgi:TonB family protein
MASSAPRGGAPRPSQAPDVQPAPAAPGPISAHAPGAPGARAAVEPPAGPGPEFAPQPPSPATAAPEAPAAPQPTPAPTQTEPRPRPTPVLSPPVPIALDPPRHPGAWHVVVETPGLAAGVRPEQVTARVRLRLAVGDDGSVADVQVAVPSGRGDLDAAAVAAARGWRFHPARRDGVAIASTVLIWVTFVVEP